MNDDLKNLKWLIAAGADEATGEAPVNRYAAVQAEPAPARPAQVQAPAQAQAAPPKAPPEAPSKPASGAAELAASCPDLASLARAMGEFDGCSLRLTATNLVFADGNPESGLMLIGEAPGVEEDRRGLPFVGRSGQLLDRMLAAIGRDRTGAYISNIVPWRPPGNRNPTPAEFITCLPFIERHIELVAPRILVLLGKTAVSALLNRTEGITKIRGSWLKYPFRDAEIPVMPTFHPAYLLRNPAAKRESWHDFLAVKKKLDGTD